jgi:hypothetical protein
LTLISAFNHLQRRTARRRSSGVGLSNLSDRLLDQFNDVDEYDQCDNDQATELDHLPLKKV